MSRVVLFTALAACGARTELRVAPLPLERVAPALRTGSPVELDTVDGVRASVRADQDVEVVGLDGHRFAIKLADVVRDCGRHAPESNQLCELHDVRDVVVGTARERHYMTGSAAGYAIMSGVLLGTIGLGICGGECGAPYNYVAGGALVVTGAAFLSALLTSDVH